MVRKMVPIRNGCISLPFWRGFIEAWFLAYLGGAGAVRFPFLLEGLSLRLKNGRPLVAVLSISLPIGRDFH